MQSTPREILPPQAAALRELARCGHLCSVYENEAERVSVAVDFMQIGLERGDRCVHVADEQSWGRIHAGLRENGVNVAKSMAARALIPVTARRAGLKRDGFDPFRMFTYWKRAAEQAYRDGFATLRGVCDMHCIMQGAPETDRWVEYEHQLTRLAQDCRCTFLCQYDRRRFAPGLLLDVIRTHPTVIHQGVVNRNILYTQNDERFDTSTVILESVLRAIREHARSELAVRAAQTELARASRMFTLGELTAAIAHEVAQPLGSVITNGDAALRWLSGDFPNLNEARMALGRMIDSGRRASGVIERIRALAGKSKSEKAPLGINDAIREVIALADDELKRNQVSVSAELADSLPPVSADRVQIQQVMLNLIVNALEAIGEQPEGPRRIVIRTSRRGADRVVVSVQDSGIGLDPRNLQDVFNAFFTTKPHGMGIGLSVSKTIVEAHGGTLWAEQNATGRGATFHFTLPLHRENP